MYKMAEEESGSGTIHFTEVDNEQEYGQFAS